MRSRQITTVAALALGLLLWATPDDATARSRLVSALGKAKVEGQDVLVEVIVLVRPGRDAAEVARRALADQRAIPVDPANPRDRQVVAFALNGLKWDQFFDGDSTNDFVRQNYNPANEPVDGLAALLSTHATWTNDCFPSAEFGPNRGLK
jgi:hypothetical protein